MPSIANMLGLIEKVGSPFITVHQDRCALVRNRHADCLRCAGVCTSGCIHYDEQAEQLVITPELCIGCGTCATVCPTCCLEAHHPNDTEMIERCRTAARATGGTITIACGTLLSQAAGLYDTDKVVRVECLGRVEESVLTLMQSEGANIVLVHGQCAECEHRCGWNMLQTVLETEKTLLEAWRQPLNVRVSAKLPAATRRATDEAFDKSKRQAFEESGKDAARVGGVLADFAVSEITGAKFSPQKTKNYVKVMADGTLPHFLPDRRERLLDALATFGDPDDVMIDTRLWGHVIIDTEKCQSCRMCAAFCPTGALRKFGEDEGEGSEFGVEHYPGDCVKCRSCEKICPADAITISEEVFARELFAGATDAYYMKPVPVKRGQAHTIWKLQQTMCLTDQVYER